MRPRRKWNCGNINLTKIYPKADVKLFEILISQHGAFGRTVCMSFLNFVLVEQALQPLTFWSQKAHIPDGVYKARYP